MFERYLAEALANYFGDLIEDFDENKVRISVWNGEVVLKDLKIKGDALENFFKRRKRSASSNRNNRTTKESNHKRESSKTNDVDDDDSVFPFRIVYGRIGVFELRIPWSLFRGAAQRSSKEDGYWSSMLWGNKNSSPDHVDSNTDKDPSSITNDAYSSCSIVLSDVIVLVAPGKYPKRNNQNEKHASPSTNTAEVDASLLLDRMDKEREVQRLLDAILFRKNLGIASTAQGLKSRPNDTTDTAHKVSTSSTDSTKNSKVLWFKNLIQNVISSLSVTIRNIHIRYEDPGDCLGFQTSEEMGVKHNIRHRPPFAIGITLDEFFIASTENGPPKDPELFTIPSMSHEIQHHDCLKSENENLYKYQHKLIAAKELSVYWDSDVSSDDLVHRYVAKLCRRRKRNQGIDDTGLFADVENDHFTESKTNQLDDDIDDYLYLAKLKELRELPPKSKDMQENATINNHQTVHTYIIQPISPSFHLSLVHVVEDEMSSTKYNIQTMTHSMSDLGLERTNNAQKEIATIPPSRAVLTFPPLQINVSKAALEDVAYIRKSFALWNEMKNSLLSQKAFSRLTQARPSVSPLLDPRGWWKYAYEAVTTISKIKKANDDPSSHQKKNKGWLGLIRLLKLKKDYMTLYQQMLCSDVDAEKQAINEKLSLLEDDLEPHEIVSFRLSLLRQSSYEPEKSDAANNIKADSIHHMQATTGWKEWMKPWNATKRPCDKDPQLLDTPNILSYKDFMSHRRKEMMHFEMTQIFHLEEEIIEEASHAGSIDQYLGNSDTLPTQSDLSVNSKFEMSVICPQIVLQVVDVLPEPHTQIKFNHIGRGKKLPMFYTQPILQVSCASVQKFSLRQSSSWDVICTLASLEVLDLVNHSRGNIIQDHKNTIFASHPTRILTRKRNFVHTESTNIETNEEKPVRIGNRLHRHSASVIISKVFFGNKSDCTKDLIDSVTSINVRVSPMEAIYSIDTMQSLSEIFSTAKTPELLSDYQRLRFVISNWQAEQKRKIMEVLAHTENKVVLNIDIAAPVLLVKDEISENTLVIDLGRLSLLNADNDLKQNQGESVYDSCWNLSLKDIQVFCAILSENQDKPAAQHLVEPFSLDFVVKTKIGSSAWENGFNVISNKVLIKATLPRLVFNLTSSAVRLVNFLRQYRGIRKARRKTTAATYMHNSVQFPLNHSSPSNSNKENKESHIHFDFSAPLIALRLSNDVDGRDYPSSRVTPICELVVHGIGGYFSNTITFDETKKTHFAARIRSLHAVDLYQNAGENFSLLLSSQKLESYPGGLSSLLSRSYLDSITNNDHVDKSTHKNDRSDLVIFEYCKHHDKRLKQSDINTTIKFHELYVEWNPETLAAMQKAMRFSIKEKTFFSNLFCEKETYIEHPFIDVYESMSLEESMAFFDAVEDGADSCEDVFLSDISSTDDNDSVENISFESAPNHNHKKSLLSPLVMKAVESIVRPLDECFGEQNATIPIQHDHHDSPIRVAKLSISKIDFQLSKLRIRFNKESRHRHLVTAEMINTSVTYLTKSSGGSKTTAKVGNLTFSDPTSSSGATLYGQILGLKTDVHKAASMLDISYETFQRQPDQVWEHDSEFKADDMTERLRPVLFDRKSCNVKGCDAAVSLHFSPMKFVYLQQLWLEIIDYFFEGITGYEVWGRDRPDISSDCTTAKPVDDLQANEVDYQMEALPAIDTSLLKIMLFNVTMDSPVIVLPVTYRSPQHLRFELEKVHFSNLYTSHILRDIASSDLSRFRIQWFNNYSISFVGLKLSSWCGAQLNIAVDPKINGVRSSERGSSLGMDMEVRWPVGPNATRIEPKWNIKIRIDPVRLLLKRNDYALFQHIILHNIGENSRHLDEWNALQNLPSEALRAYKDMIMVHFGYDKKDGPPTTFHFTISISSIVIHFYSQNYENIADVDCSGMKWSLKKLKDRISKQELICNSIELVQTSGTKEWSMFEKLLFPLQEEPLPTKKVLSPDSSPIPKVSQLLYRSTSRPNGDNVKYLEVNNACIYFIYPAWVFIKNFFQSLPDPDIMDSNDVLTCVQVADRWYKIGMKKSAETKSNLDLNRNNFIGNENIQLAKHQNQPDFQFRVVLSSPRIVLVSDSSSMQEKKDCKAVTLRLSHLDFLHTNKPSMNTKTKSIFLHDLEIFTGSADNPVRNDCCSEEHSLLYPLCVGAGLSEDYILSVDPNHKYDLEIYKWASLDVISARAAYTDMSLAIDVVLRAISDFRSAKSLANKIEPSDASSRSTSNENSHSNLSSLRYRDVKEILNIQCGGFDLLVIDDSERHFAGAQELIQMSLSGIRFQRSKVSPEGQSQFISNTQLELAQLELLDMLQPTLSPFRTVAATHDLSRDHQRFTNDLHDRRKQGDHKARWSKMNSILFEDFMCWEKYSMVECVEWGYSISPLMMNRSMKNNNSRTTQSNLIEINYQSHADIRDESIVKIRPLVIQWNPSMAIALQRFLGRLRKEAIEKKFFSNLSGRDSCIDLNLRPDGVFSSEEKNESVSIQTRMTRIFTKFEIDSLTVCLNKEHQHRRLLQLTFSDNQVTIERDEDGRLSVYGCISDLNAWDADGDREGQIPMCHSNRLVLSVIHSKISDTKLDSDSNLQKSFLSFKYFSQRRKDIKSIKIEVPKTLKLELPVWVRVLIGQHIPTERLDDCLSISMATVRFNYIRERTGEIVDYLSNGLPGKGMGATSRAAKGFINKRIKTRSFLNILIDNPQLVLPRHRGNEEGFILCLGNVNVRSWFEEATLHESEAIECDKLSNYSNWNIDPCSKSNSYDSADSFPVSPRTPNLFQNQRYWWRVLSVSLIEIVWQINMFDSNNRVSSSKTTKPVNLHLLLRKPQSTALPMIIRSNMSFVDVTLSYSEYVLIRSVLSDNIIKASDTALWDNMEKAFSIEESETTDNFNFGTVKYSKNARFVRYGIMAQQDSPSRQSNSTFSEQLPQSEDVKKSTALDLKFQLDGLHLTLHRDDIIESISETKNNVHLSANYDMVLFKVQKVTMLCTANSKGGKSARIQFYRICLLDLGDKGRLDREIHSYSNSGVSKNNKSIQSKTRKQSVFSVIADVCDDMTSESKLEMNDPQLILEINTSEKDSKYFQGFDDASSKSNRKKRITTAMILINSMNINLLISPLIEIKDFFTCAWHVGNQKHHYQNHVHEKDHVNSSDRGLKPLPLSPRQSSIIRKKLGGFQIKLIAQYPRVFLLADESDPSTRALVLRGRAIVNASFIRESTSLAHQLSQDDDIQTYFSVQVQVQSLETYINPDPRSALERPLSQENNVENTNGNDFSGSLGVALIEPVTVAFEFHQILRDLFPKIRTICLNMESVSTTLSFEDMRLIETVLKRWKSERKWAKQIAASQKMKNSHFDYDASIRSDLNDFDSQTHYCIDHTKIIVDSPPSKPINLLTSNSGDSLNQNDNYCGECLGKIDLPCTANSSQIERSFSTSNESKYFVVFYSEKLGLALRKSGSSVQVESVIKQGDNDNITVGDEIIAINGVNVEGMNFQSVVSLLSSAKRPMTVTFSKFNTPVGVKDDTENLFDNETDKWDHRNNRAQEDGIESVLEGNQCSYDTKIFDISDSHDESYMVSTSDTSNRTSISFRSGVQNGLHLDRSLCGNFAIISQIHRDTFLSNKVGRNESFVPKPGTVILSINDEPAHKLGYEGTLKALQVWTSSANSPNVDETYSLEFLTVSSKDWGVALKVDVIVSGIKLTLIDDINGRDMPLLRGSLESIAVKVDKGLGVDCNSIQVQPPSLIMVTNSTFDGYNSFSRAYNSSNQIDNESEVILKVCMNTVTSWEYYNARIATWEPFIEICHISGELEWQKGSDCRPGALSVALSDYVAISGTDSMQQKLICINLTDAAAELLCTTFWEWKLWRASYQENMKCDYSDESSSPIVFKRSQSNLLNYSQDSSISLERLQSEHTPGQRIAASNAAQAALIFAKRRGVDAQKSDNSNPFVLRNQTGMSISFVSQTKANVVEDSKRIEDELVSDHTSFDLSDYNESEIRKVEAGAEARFNIYAINDDLEFSVDNSKDVNKVRAYDGHFPHISVILHSPFWQTQIEVMRNMSVVKVGQTMKRLLVSSSMNDDISDDSSYDDSMVDHSRFVLVVWKVHLENNRRIVTISSAISIGSSYSSIPFDIGLKYNEVDFSADESSGEIQSLGISRNNEAFFLPLWISLLSRKAEIFVRPSVLSKDGTKIYEWSSRCVLKFDDVSLPMKDSKIDECWSWSTSNLDRTICCYPSKEYQSEDLLYPAWLSLSDLSGVEDVEPMIAGECRDKQSLSAIQKLKKYRKDRHVISLEICASVSIRNILPVGVEWELSNTPSISSIDPINVKDDDVIDGSNLRRLQMERHGWLPFSDPSKEESFVLQSGSSVDVFCCDITVMILHVRFRCYSSDDWSEWAQINTSHVDILYSSSSFDVRDVETVEGIISDNSAGYSAVRELDVQTKSNFGVPLNLGLKIIPKCTILSVVDDHSIRNVKGYNLILFSELWMNNLTSLPIVFGSPSCHLHRKHKEIIFNHNDNVRKITAEAALMEISSILEFGDKGKVLGEDSTDIHDDNDIFILPRQQSEIVVEEVFEYIELENGTQKRRWWADEQHYNTRSSPFSFSCANGWQWLDDNWIVDSSGKCNLNSGAWESCSNVFGGQEKTFSKEREFNMSHNFRRRRWFRRRFRKVTVETRNSEIVTDDSLKIPIYPPARIVSGDDIVFHHPIRMKKNDHFDLKGNAFNLSRQESQVSTKSTKNISSGRGLIDTSSENEPISIVFKVGDSKWSAPVFISSTGPSNGVVRIAASRWPGLKLNQIDGSSQQLKINDITDCESLREPGCLSTNIYDLSYQLSPLEGSWGDFTKLFTLSPRFFVRNDSQKWDISVKQVGTPDQSALHIKLGEVVPFYWADRSLPELVCVRPIPSSILNEENKHRQKKTKYRWSGGFDINTLGMVPLRVRRDNSTATDSETTIQVISAIIETRSGTGGTGIMLSLKEELENGGDSLYRIENHTPFTLWISQDGILADPTFKTSRYSAAPNAEHRVTESNFYPEAMGDIVKPMQHIAYGLDIPFRQGKYSHRRADSIEELLKLRVGLAPFPSRDGIETTKVINFSALGACIRLRPTALRFSLSDELISKLSSVRIVGLVHVDGPTRVLRFCLVNYGISNTIPTSNTGKSGRMYSSIINDRYLNASVTNQITRAAMNAIQLLKEDKIPKERKDIILAYGTKLNSEDRCVPMNKDCHYSFRASFSGFVFSLIDSVPSEIAVVSLSKVDTMCNWNSRRTSDATAVISIGKMQIDNLTPSAPYPIAFRPDDSKKAEEDEELEKPFVTIGIVLAPQHKSQIMCLKGITIAPRNIVVAMDLAFIMRLQRFLLGLHEHSRRSKQRKEIEPYESWSFPDLNYLYKHRTKAMTGGKKIYVECLTILPFNLNFSVAPAVALTSAQAAVEGHEAAAIHAAVRKGDVLFGDCDGILGVQIGTKNRTLLATIRGVFKSILVDALLRCDGASMTFSGVALSNIILTAPQLKTYLGAHYLSSLKKNVPALLGSLSAFGNPLGLIRGLGDGVSDFVSEPVKGLKRSVLELDPTYVVHGVAKGTGSLARHTVGGLVDTASLLTETFSKNMAVLTLDRNYAQRRDRLKTLPGTTTTFVEAVESGVGKLLRGVAEGVIGVVRAPMRGAERKGVEGFAKGIGKGLLGLVVKPVIGLSDAATDVMAGLKGFLDSGHTQLGTTHAPLRPRRAFHGRDRVLRSYEVTDAISASIMIGTRLAGENYLCHCDMGGRVAIFSVKKFLLLGDDGNEQLLIKFKHMLKVELRPIPKADGKVEWGVLIFLKKPRKNGNEVEVVISDDKKIAVDLCSKINQGINLGKES